MSDKTNKNQLISEFMGNGSELNYDKSWDALMPVVFKINSFRGSPRPFVYGNPESVKLIISEVNVKINASFWTNPHTVNGNHWSHLSKRFNYNKYTPLEAAYQAVLAFVIWFKNEKQEISKGEF